jgi:predicted nucleic acid-binding protein
MSQRSKRSGLDTSFVLRLLVGNPGKQARLAEAELDRLVSEGMRGAVSDLVVSEVYFALQHHYEVPKQVALDTLRDFLESPEIEPLGSALKVLQQPGLGKANPGFVDRLIHADYLDQASAMLTFEKAAKKLPGVGIPQ